MANLPTDIANQALDAAGVDFTLGDLEEGSREAQVSLRAYRQCLMQLLRAVHWNFARKTAPLTLLADATGQTLNVGTQVPVPWIYEYAYPIDCMKARFIPWNPQSQSAGIPPGNIQIGAAPVMTGLGQPSYGQRIVPARFLVATDFNYPPVQGQITWEVQGVSPQGRTVILTNVQSAQMVYTALMLYPSVWDPLFRAAMVAYLASEVALPLDKSPGKKMGMTLRAQNIAIVKQKLMEARITDGNEAGFANSDIKVDWMRARNSGGSQNGWGNGWTGGPGVWGYGGDGCSFSDGSSLGAY